MNQERDSPSVSDLLLQKTRQILAKWRLPRDKLGSEWKQLSGGESQRVIVAIGLASLAPEIISDSFGSEGGREVAGGGQRGGGGGGVLLLDEPTSALDASTRDLVERTVRE